LGIGNLAENFWLWWINGVVFIDQDLHILVFFTAVNIHPENFTKLLFNSLPHRNFTQLSKNPSFTKINTNGIT